jgi:hypothetical protein
LIGTNTNVVPGVAGFDRVLEPGLPSAAVGTKGHVVFGWLNTSEPTGGTRFELASSNDGGRSFHPRTIATRQRPALAPALGFAGKRLAIAYYQVLKPSTRHLRVGLRLATLNGSDHLRTLNLGQAFDAERLPVRSGQTGANEVPFGFHVGLVTERGIKTASLVPRPVAHSGASDVIVTDANGR